MSKSKQAAAADYAELDAAGIFTKVAGGEQMRGAVSKTIRQLAAEGFTTGQIAKMLNKRYQHVRNVLHEPAKK
jgi:hypothetical protein